MSNYGMFVEALYTKDYNSENKKAGGFIMKKNGKRFMASVLEKVGRNVAVGGGGDPTHWAFYEFEIPDSVNVELEKRAEAKKAKKYINAKNRNNI